MRQLYIPILIIIISLFSCSKKIVKDHYLHPDPDINISNLQTEKLSDQLAGFDSLLAVKNGIYTMEEGDISLIARAWLTDAAEKSIDVQYFIFSTDNVGTIAIDYLLRAANRGVKVRMLVDDFMLDSDVELLVALDAHPNLEIKIYNPTANIGKNLPKKLYSLATNFRGFNQRMHNKTFIVDKRVAITGGRNVADEYFDYDHEYNFRDRDVLLLGKVVEVMNGSFQQFWESDLSTNLSSLPTNRLSKKEIDDKCKFINSYAKDPQNFWPQVRDKIKTIPDAFKYIQKSKDLVWCDSVAYISDLPGKNSGDFGLKGSGVCTDSLISLVRRAKSSIYMQTPYLITTKMGKKIFRDAINRGVKINILSNSLASTDNLEAFSGYQRDRQELLDIGVNLYEFRPDAQVRFKIMTSALQKSINFTPTFGLHAKSMVVDDSISVVGTFNLDPRSANLNTECITVIYDKKIAANISNAMKEEINPENAWKVEPTFNPDVNSSAMKRFGVWWRRIVPKSIL